MSTFFAVDHRRCLRRRRRRRRRRQQTRLPNILTRCILKIPLGCIALMASCHARAVEDLITSQPTLLLEKTIFWLLLSDPVRAHIFCPILEIIRTLLALTEQLIDFCPNP